MNSAIADLRMSLRKLPALSSEGWKYMVAKTTAPEGLFKIVVTVPSVACQVHVPVAVLVCAHNNCGARMQASLDKARITVMHADSTSEVLKVLSYFAYIQRTYNVLTLVQVSTEQAKVVIQLLETRLSQ